MKTTKEIIGIIKGMIIEDNQIIVESQESWFARKKVNSVLQDILKQIEDEK